MNRADTLNAIDTEILKYTAQVATEFASLKKYGLLGQFQNVIDTAPSLRRLLNLMGVAIEQMKKDYEPEIKILPDIKTKLEEMKGNLENMKYTLGRIESRAYRLKKLRNK